MTQDLFSRRTLGMSGALAVLLCGLTAGPALAKGTVTAVDTSACSDPLLSQPFLSANDSNLYTLAPGEAVDSFDGTGWTLSGGAQIISTRLADGQTGNVLDLPAGSQAVSPTMCVSAAYPTARTMVQGDQGSQVTFSVSYAGTKTWDKAKKTGQIQTTDNGWSLSDSFNVQPGNLPGWQLVRFTFSGDKENHAQLYNFYVDPRMKG